MSKKFKGKLCVYCAEASSTSSDHVFAREFFLLADRLGLPKVPACDQCNNKKSELEHYLASLLPFGGRHRDALATLETMVPKRLRKNARLHRKLAQELGTAWSQECGGLYLPVLTLPIDIGRLERLFSLIVKGLLWHHWQTYITRDYFVKVSLLTKAEEKFVDERFFSLSARARVEVNLGNDTFSYEGIQGVDCPQVTVWRLCVYGGVRFGGDAEAPSQVSSRVGVVTGPKSIRRNADLMARFGVRT